MKINIIKIGNSQGIRIPKTILEQCEFQDEVEIDVKDKSLIIRPAKHPREDWDSFFKLMTNQNDDSLIIDEPHELSSWESEEWEW